MRNRDTESGKFISTSEPVVSRPIAIRLPPSLEMKLRKYAGDAIAPWIREAITEKLERIKKQEASQYPCLHGTMTDNANPEK